MNSRIVEAGVAKNIDQAFKNVLWSIAQQSSKRYYQPLNLTTPRQQQQFTLRTYNSLLYRAGTNQIKMDTDAAVLRNVANKDAKAAYNASVLKAQQVAQAKQQTQQTTQTAQSNQPETQQAQTSTAKPAQQTQTQQAQAQQKGTGIGNSGVRNIGKEGTINMRDLEVIKQNLENLRGRLSRLNKGLKNSIVDLRIMDGPAIGKKVYKLPAHLVLTIKTGIPVPVKDKQQAPKEQSKEQQAESNTQQTAQSGTEKSGTEEPKVKEAIITEEDCALLEAYKYKEELCKYEELFGKKVDPANYIISEEGRKDIKKVIENAFENSLINYEQTTLIPKVGEIKIMDARGTEIKDPGEDEELEGYIEIETPVTLEEGKPKLGDRILHGVGTVLKVLSAGR